MKNQLTTTFLMLAALLVPAAAFAADGDTDRTHPVVFVKDSAITTKIKTKLAAEKMSSLVRIGVDTDASGMVVLSGTARTRTDADKAVSIARGTEGVMSVRDDIKIRKDD